MIDLTLPGYFNQSFASFTVDVGTQGRIIVDVTPAQVVTAVAGETALAGEAAVRQRVLTGGCQINDGRITSTDAAAKSLLLYIGEQLSLYVNMGTVTTTATTNATLTRTVGSFITDGYQVGQSVMLVGSLSNTNNLRPAIITAVTATVLTFSGVAAISVAETQGAGFRVLRVAQVGRIAIPANSGNSDTIPPVKLIGHVNDAATTDTIALGATDVLIGAMSAAVSALPATVYVTAAGGLY